LNGKPEGSAPFHLEMTKKAAGIIPQLFSSFSNFYGVDLLLS